MAGSVCMRTPVYLSNLVYTRRRFALSRANRFVDPQVENAYIDSVWIDHQRFGVFSLTCICAAVVLLRVVTVEDYIYYRTLEQFKLDFWFLMISASALLVLLLLWCQFGLYRIGPHRGAAALVAVLWSMAFTVQLSLTHLDAVCWTEWATGPDNREGITWQLNSELRTQVQPYIGAVNQELAAMVAAVPIIGMLVVCAMSLPMHISVPTVWLLTITQTVVRVHHEAYVISSRAC